MSEPESPDTPATASTRPDTTNLDAKQDAEFAVFYRELIKPLVAFLILQGAALADAADLAQDTMIKAYEKWRIIDHPRAWTYRVASRALIRRMVEKRDVPSEQLPEPNLLLRGTDIEHWEQLQDLVRALVTLPHRQRQIMAWTLTGYTPTEIAHELRMKAGTVRQNLSLARSALIQLMREGGDQ